MKRQSSFLKDEQKITCNAIGADYGPCMATMIPLEKMSRVEKLRAMEAIWADLSREDAEFESPDWHEEALRDAERALESGTAKFVDWEEAKKRLRRKAARLV